MLIEIIEFIGLIYFYYCIILLTRFMSFRLRHIKSKQYFENQNFAKQNYIILVRHGIIVR